MMTTLLARAVEKLIVLALLVVMVIMLAGFFRGVRNLTAPVSRALTGQVQR